MFPITSILTLHAKTNHTVTQDTIQPAPMERQLSVATPPLQIASVRVGLRMPLAPPADCIGSIVGEVVVLLIAFSALSVLF
jgi:hypothetical protein